MPEFTIEQYELHAQKFRVEAATAAEAIQKLFNGGADPMDNELDFIGVCEDRGMPYNQHERLADHLRQLGIHVTDVIPSIRSIEES